MKKIALICAALLLVTLSVFAHDSGKSCNMKSKDGKMADMPGTPVEMTGKLLCKHCNLHQSETCEKVFQPSSDEKKLYAVCGMSKVDVEKVSEEGAAVLKVKGKLVKCGEDGKEELLIDEATKVN